MKGDSTVAIDFLQRWAPGGPWLITAVDPPRAKKLVANTFDNPAEALAFIEHWNGVRNLYFTVNRPKQFLATKASKQDIGWLTALHVDVDPSDPPEGVDPSQHYQEQRRIIWERLEKYPVPPSVIIFSGGGYGAFWLMANPVEVKDNIEELESYNQQLERDLQGDHCWNIDRIMRLPGTVNIPDPKKSKKGRVEVVSNIVKADWNYLYDLAQFKQYKEEKKTRKKKVLKEEDDWLDRIIKFGPDHEGPRSYDRDRSKALWAVCCALVRRNHTIDEIVAIISNKSNKISDHLYDQADPLREARRQAEKAHDAAMGDFTFNESGKPHPTQENVRVALSMLEVKLLYNEFADRAYIEGPDGLPRRLIGDRELNGIYLRIAREFGFRPSIDLFKMMIEDDAYANKFHPVKEYLSSLKWDGKNRIDKWLIDYGHAEDTAFVRAVSRIALIAAVHRIRVPGCKYDEIIVLESPQGYNKSSALAALATNQEWFTDSMPLNAKDKELIEILQGKWIVESPELKGMKFGEVEHHKAMLSRQTDRARLSYGRFASEVPRHSIFFGTTNSSSYLADMTGNRRFWTIRVGEFDVEGLKKVVNQLWAEAAYAEDNGESIRLPRELWEDASAEQKKREIGDPWETAVANALEPYEGGKIKSFELWDLINVPLERRDQRQNARFGEIMRSLGWTRDKMKFGGKTTEWGYHKGNDQEKRKRIIIVREQSTGRLSIEREDEGMARTIHGPEYYEEDM